MLWVPIILFPVVVFITIDSGEIAKSCSVFWDTFLDDKRTKKSMSLFDYLSKVLYFSGQPALRIEIS